MKRPEKNTTRVSLALTKQQLVALYMACSELEIVCHEQLKHHFPFQPEQKKHIKIACRKLRKHKVWDKIEDALEQAEAQS